MKLSPHEIFIPLIYALVLLQSPACAATDLRYLPDGVEIARNADGSIERSSKVLADFQKIHPCPSTGLTTGKCPGWGKDHVIPLICRGRDAVYNLAWMPNIIKSGSGRFPKDRWERKIYCDPIEIVKMPSESSLLMIAP